jgi:hypothetical protein
MAAGSKLQGLLYMSGMGDTSLLLQRVRICLIPKELLFSFVQKSVQADDKDAY